MAYRGDLRLGKLYKVSRLSESDIPFNSLVKLISFDCGCGEDECNHVTIEIINTPVSDYDDWVDSGRWTIDCEDLEK